MVITTISGLRNYLGKHRSKGKTIGFVPTMGFLHEGHLSLIRRANMENDVVVMSHAAFEDERTQPNTLAWRAMREGRIHEFPG